MNAFTDGCEIQSFIGKLFDGASKYPGMREKAVEIYILSTSRNLSLLYPRDKALEKTFLEVSKILLDNPLSTFDKALSLSNEIFQKKEAGFNQLRLDMIETETPKPVKMSLPNLDFDITFNSTEIINNPLDNIERTLKELLDTEIHFYKQLLALLNNAVFQLNPNYKDYEILATASKCLIDSLSKSGDEKTRFIACLDAFSSDHSHPYFLAFKKPIQISAEVSKWMAQTKISGNLDSSDILIAPIQRVVKIKLLLERLHQTCNIGPAKDALTLRIDNVKKWLALYNLL